jgi:hypothetical protein
LDCFSAGADFLQYKQRKRSAFELTEFNFKSFYIPEKNHLCRQVIVNADRRAMKEPKRQTRQDTAYTSDENALLELENNLNDVS